MVAGRYGRNAHYHFAVDLVGTIEWTLRELLERLAALCALISASVAIYGGGLPVSRGNYPLQVVVVPPLMWVAVRFGQRETATAMLVLTVVATYGTTSGYGPFAAASGATGAGTSARSSNKLVQAAKLASIGGTDDRHCSRV